MTRSHPLTREERARSRLFQRVREEIKADKAGAVQALNKAVGDLVTISEGSNQPQFFDPRKYGALRIAKYVCMEPREISASSVDQANVSEEGVVGKAKKTPEQSTRAVVEESSSGSLASSANAKGDGKSFQTTSEAQKAPINLPAYLQHQMEQLEHAGRFIDERYRK